MTCYYPLQAYDTGIVNPKSGKNFIRVVGSITKDFNPPINAIPMKLDCGQCHGCKLKKSSEWATRMMHEASLHKHNQFVTLTYSEDTLPIHDENGIYTGPTLVKKELTNFFKRLRKKHKVRFYGCGEYGEENQRPHYHAIIFGLELNDKIYHNTNNGHNQYTSKTLQSFWRCRNRKGKMVDIGYATTGDNVSHKTCAYVARYTMKKITGKHAQNHYLDIDKTTGEVLTERLPEFVRMSRGGKGGVGGIGKKFYDKWKSDMYPNGLVYLPGGKTTATSRYYDSLHEENNEVDIENIKKRRKQYAIQNALNKNKPSLKSQEIVSLSKSKQLIRTLEK